MIVCNQTHVHNGPALTLVIVVKRNEDSDLVATSSVMSLKCPLSTLRIELPVRSKICTHIQCFDAMSYLLLQQQAPVSLIDMFR